MSVEDLLVQTCSIRRETVTIGDRGQSIVTKSYVESDIRCNIQFATIVREEYETALHGERSITTYLGFFEYGIDIQEGDEVVMQDDGDSRVFHVDRVALDSVGRGSHIEADLEIV